MALILHCIDKSLWDVRKDLDFWGEEEISAEGFIHFSQPFYFWRVAPNFIGSSSEKVLLLADTEKLVSELRYEDADGCGREYPHLYGLMNNDAVIDVLPFSLDPSGNWIKNPELLDYQDK